MDEQTSTKGYQVILKYLRDPMWEFIGTIIAIIALFVSIYFSFLSRDLKALQVVILSNTSLVEFEKSIAQDMKILYKDKDIINLSAIQIKLESIGDQAILEEDYVHPISFVFPSQTEVIDASVLESVPPGIGFSIQTIQNTAILSATLLNPNDRAIIRFLVANMPPKSSAKPFKIDARIVEVPSISIINAIEQPSPVNDLFSQIVLFLLGALIVLTGQILKKSSQKWMAKIVAVLLIATVLMWAVFSLEGVFPQIVLLLLATLILLTVPFLQVSRQKWVIKILAVLIMVILLIWAVFSLFGFR